ncbi:unnamed protein product [Auanema sp. JU1783]|nr:unnamed protein product [Auanema sp. JU1783]
MSRKYSFTLSEDDFRKQIKPQVDSVQIPSNQRAPSVIPSLNKKYEYEDFVKTTLKNDQRQLNSRQSVTDNLLAHQNKTNFNKTVRPRSNSHSNVYKRFSNSRYFDWDDTAYVKRDSLSFNQSNITDDSSRIIDERRECVLCRFARDAIEKEKKEEKLKKEDMMRKTYQSEHCRQLEYLEKLLQ